MLIDLPPLQEYSMADCQDLFISKMDEDYDVDACAGPEGRKSGLDAPQLDAEPFAYTSSSESDIDACFSDIEVSMDVLAGELRKTQLCSHSIMPPSAKKLERNLALHSPGQLLGTPRDPSRRYEYPFPAHLRAYESDMAENAASSTASTPGLTPAEGCSLGLVPFAGPISFASRSASQPVYMQVAPPAPVPVPVPSPSAMPATSNAGNVSRSPLAPLAQAQAVPSPSSASVVGPSTVATHPKLSRFNPADAPVPPGLRGRTRKSASVSTPQVLQSATSTVSVPTTTVGSS